MTLILENVNEEHIRLLKEMADVLKFEFKELKPTSSKILNSDSVNFELEEKEMTLVSMQASTQPLAELWDKEEDAYWNSYL